MRIVSFVVFVPLLFAACGGSGGSSSGSGLDRFAGEYGFVGFLGAEMTAYGNPRTTAESSWGGLESDGMGLWETLFETSNAEGGVSSAIIIGPPAPYTLDEPHGLALSTNEVGAVSGDGSAWASMRFTPPAIQIGCHPAGMIPPGDYALFTFQYVAGSDSALWGAVTLTPTGGISDLIYSANINGALLLDVSGVVPGSHASDPDGLAQVVIGDADLEGTVGPGGRFVILAGSTANGTNQQMVMVLVRLSSSAGDGLFLGEYDGVYIDGPNVAGGAPAWYVRRHTLRADGAGMVEARTGVGSRDGRFEPGGSSFGSPMPYSVSADGTVVTPTQRGALTTDGRVLVLAGGVTGGSRPSFAFYVR